MANENEAQIESYMPPRLLTYLLWIIKNIIGWVLILSSGIFGMAVPGPGGLPMFIIGFALITFPGKRRLTARVLRGMPVDPRSRAYRWFVALFAILVPAAAISWWIGRWWPFKAYYEEKTLWTLATVVLYLSSVTLLWVFGLRGVGVINWIMRGVPMARRRVRPWMRRKGFDLLPPRRRRRLRGQAQDDDMEILEIHERHHHRLRYLWKVGRPWLIRLVRVAVILAVFAWMLTPIYHNWDDPAVRQRVLSTNWWHFAAAAAMFTIFLFTFRAIVWRNILIGLGHTLPVAPATRIWSMSEMARYIPGVIWQVAGRIFLSKPYGVSGGVSSASQLLELGIFMLANIVVAIACIVVAGFRLIPADQRHWLFIAMGFVPVLLLLLHPPIFYGLMNALMRRLGKPEVENRLRKRKLLVLGLWTMLGLLWQSLAIWLLTYSTLGLPLGKWYVLAGSYCLAWTIGFSVGFLSPGGIGVRELVFVTMLRFLLPPEFVENYFKDPAVLLAVAGFVGVVLRLWAIAGELTLAGLTLAFDYRGATNRPDAPGRVPFNATERTPSPATD